MKMGVAFGRLAGCECRIQGVLIGTARNVLDLERPLNHMYLPEITKCLEARSYLHVCIVEIKWSHGELQC